MFVSSYRNEKQNNVIIITLICLRKIKKLTFMKMSKTQQKSDFFFKKKLYLQNFENVLFKDILNFLETLKFNQTKMPWHKIKQTNIMTITFSTQMRHTGFICDYYSKIIQHCLSHTYTTIIAPICIIIEQK